MTSVRRPSGEAPVTVRNQYGPSASCLRRPFRRRRFSLSRSNAALMVCGVAMCRTLRADQPVEGLQQIDVDFAALVRTGPLDLELVGGRVGEGPYVEQRLAAARLDVEHVAQDVLLPEAVCALRLGGVEQKLLLLGAAGLQIVERVFVGFETHDLDDAGTTFGFLRCGKALGLPVRPFWRESHLLDARQQYSVEVVAHFDENEFASLTVLTVEVDDGVAGGAGAPKKSRERRHPPPARLRRWHRQQYVLTSDKRKGFCSPMMFRSRLAPNVPAL